MINHLIYSQLKNFNINNFFYFCLDADEYPRYYLYYSNSDNGDGFGCNFMGGGGQVDNCYDQTGQDLIESDCYIFSFVNYEE